MKVLNSIAFQEFNIDEKNPRVSFEPSSGKASGHFRSPLYRVYSGRGHWIFFQFTESFQPHYGPGGYLASNKKEYQKSS
jgi:hypothetical protein